MDNVDVRWLMTPETPSVEELLAELVNRPAWHREAACRGIGPAAFFPERGHGPNEGLRHCQSCAVSSECLSAALEGGESTAGVWGGRTERQRRQLRGSAA
jgi:hypothetical protein